MKIVTSEQMKTLDMLAEQNFKIPSIILMENAAFSVSEVILERIKGLNKPRVNIFAGKGNNGGDGFAVARQLYSKGIDIKVFFAGKSEALTNDAKVNYDILKKIGICVKECADGVEPQAFQEIVCQTQLADINIDALLGTGLTGKPRGVIKEFIDILNKYSKYTLAIDVPSGVNATTGEVYESAVFANQTVTLALIKQGLLLNPALNYIGTLILKDIGIPQKAIESIQIKTMALTDSELKLPQRSLRTNKGDYGKLMVIAGSENMTGAAALVCRAAYKTGAGLVNFVSSESVSKAVQNKVIENVNTVVPYVDGKISSKSFEMIKDKLNLYTAVTVGSGLGVSVEVTEFMKQLLENITKPVVIDADGLNSISQDLSILKKCNAPIIITPHPKEMSRLTGFSVQYILDNTISVAKDFSAENKVVTVLKDNRTIIASPDGEVYINTTGNPSMAKAGSGDVLSGIIGGLLAQGLLPFEAAAKACYIHGKAGDLAVKKYGENGVLASELIRFI